MANISWKTAVSGNFNDTTKWNGGVVPGGADTAVLAALGGGAYTVTTQGQTINGLQTAANATVALTTGTNFQLTSGTNGGANAGQINVTNNSELLVGGTFNNTSTIASGGIALNGGANTTELRLLGANTTFTGGGSVVMNGGNNYIFGATGANNTLTNFNDTFSGTGNLGNANLTLVNQAAGIVNANQSGTLVLNVNGGVSNAGLLEDTGSGGLFVQNTTIDNRGSSNAGKVTATGSGAHVDLQNSTIYGGTLSSGAGAQIDVVTGQTAALVGLTAGAPVNITAGTNVNINNNSTLNVYGTINNAGAINLNGTANNTYLHVSSPVTTLTGGGQVVLGTGGSNYIYGLGGALNELDNVNNTISGVGNVGDGQMTLVNETAGVINANQNAALTLQVNGGVTNKGLLESTGTGGLFVLNTGIDNTQGTNAGKITATGAGAHVDLQNSSIAGGTLTAGAGAQIDVVAGQSATLNGSVNGAPINLAAGTAFNVNNNSSLFVDGIINNAGSINLEGVANNTYMKLGTPLVTLQGGGTVVLGTGGANYIYGNDTYQETLDNINNTIEGTGNIGDGQMTLQNQKTGIINANQAGLTLTVQANGGVTNNGIIEATSGGTLLILNTTVTGTGGGKIEAEGTKTVAADVELQNAYISGGTLSSVTGVSAIQIVSGQSATLDGSVKAVSQSSVFDVQNNSTLYVVGTIKNSKSINVQSGANNTDIRLNSAQVTLTGVGIINLTSTGAGGAARIYSNSSYEQLINQGNTIEGTGDIGVGTNFQLVNQTGTVNANNATGALTIQENPEVENTGLIESTGAGGLSIVNSTIDNTVANGTGVLNTGLMTASSKGHIDLSNSNIDGGTLTTTGTGQFDVVAGESGNLNGSVSGQAVNITAGSVFNVNNNTNLYLEGAINNAGTINELAGANNTNILLNSSVVTLTGGGTLALGGATPGNNRIYENQANAELDNVSDTISGGGQIGIGQAMSLTNEAGGTINAANAAGIAINIGGNQLVNAGLLEATGGSLSVTNGVYNTGNITANGGSITIGGDVEGTGNMTLDGTSNIEINSSYDAVANQTVTFGSGSKGVFKIDNAQDFTGTIAGFTGASGQGIDLANINFAGSSFNFAAGVLTVTDGTTTANLNMTGTYTNASFSLINDGAGHVEVIDPPPAGPASAPAMVAAISSFGAGSSGSGAASSGSIPQTTTPVLATVH